MSGRAHIVRNAISHMLLITTAVDCSFNANSLDINKWYNMMWNTFLTKTCIQCRRLTELCTESYIRILRDPPSTELLCSWRFLQVAPNIVVIVAKLWYMMWLLKYIASTAVLIKLSYFIPSIVAYPDAYSDMFIPFIKVSNMRVRTAIVFLND